jgi:hypothetical protein
MNDLLSADRATKVSVLPITKGGDVRKEKKKECPPRLSLLASSRLAQRSTRQKRESTPLRKWTDKKNRQDPAVLCPLARLVADVLSSVCMVLIPSCKRGCYWLSTCVIRDLMDTSSRKGPILVAIPRESYLRMERRKSCEEAEMPQDSFNSSRAGVDANTGISYLGFTTDTVPTSVAHSVIGTLVVACTVGWPTGHPPLRSGLTT